ncbi:LysE family translocator [Pseudomonas cremoricolorata]|uniref:Lysine transporter LysE n=1 Tax=Pseudomonas cremoricolorata TaxID=157783 RepID=A0A089WPV5_9PSED|nr:LysE family translocator [Pseudomonas cremoricolorata]AIR88532.1 lysine transporter LysE [Pseudomonas cremoricolorata]
MNELIAVAAITVLAVISPGPDFAMVTRTSYAYGRRHGLLAALGIACGVQVHVCYAVFGIALIITHSPLLFLAMKLLGAGYLLYLGYKSLTSTSALSIDAASGPALSNRQAFAQGFLTNALNPKTMLFVVAVYSQVVQAGSSWASSLGYGLFMSAAHWLWFSLVAVFISAPGVRQRLLARQRMLDRVIGSALIGLGLWVLWPEFAQEVMAGVGV